MFIIVNVNAFGWFIGTVLAWAGTVAGSYIVFLFFRRLNNTKYMKKVQQRTSVQRLIHFIDRRGVIPIFILMCFPFTPSALVNIVASMSHIKAHAYLTVLIISKLFSNPTRLITIVVVIIIVWFVGRKIEKHFMSSSEE